MSEPNVGGMDQYDDLIRRMYLEEKMSDAEVAEALPISVTASGVFHYRARNGIKGHRRGAKSSLDAHREEVTRLYVEERLTDGQIAARFGVGDETVRKARLRWNIATDKRKSSGRYSTDARFEEVRDQLPDLWEKSKQWHSRQQRMMGSSARVAKELGVGTSTAQGWLAQLGLVESRSAHGSDAPARATELFDTGLSVPAVAFKMGVPSDTVHHWLSGKRDLSNPHSRRSHEEKIAFRQAVSTGKGGSIAGRGQFNYNGTRLDSSYEVRFAKNLDRLGVAWQAWDRAQNGTVDIPGEEMVGQYAPDFLVGDVSVEVKGIYDATAAIKVSAWRKQRGELAMVMKNELFELESATTAKDALASLQAFCYLDPPVEKAYWD